MGLLSTLLAPRLGAGNLNPNDDRYWTDYTPTQTASGIRVDGETALRVSAVYACARILSESLASLPILVYRRLTDDSRERARDHTLMRVLHKRPNDWMTPGELIDFWMMSMLLRGKACSRKLINDQTGETEQLIPILPTLITTERLNPLADPDAAPMLRYQIRRPDGRSVYRSSDDILHIRGMSLDGIEGVSVVTYLRETIGLAIATEEFGSRFFGNGSRPGGILSSKTRLSPEAKRNLKRDWEAAHGGVGNAGRVAVLEEDMSWQAISFTNEDSQFLATRELQIAEIARAFRVPLHMIGETTKSTSWGSGIESMSIGFVIYTLLPWAKRIEQALTRDLLLDDDEYFIEFLFSSLLRGDQKSRFAAYAQGLQHGWLSPNDIRRLENQNPIPDGDKYYRPANLVELDAPPPAPEPTQAAPIRPPNGAADAHRRLLVRDAAGRIIRREIAALSKHARRQASDPEAWRAAVDEFYADHGAYVAQTLHVSQPVADEYVAEQRRQALEMGAAVLDSWETDRVLHLINLAMAAAEMAA